MEWDDRAARTLTDWIRLYSAAHGIDLDDFNWPAVTEAFATAMPVRFEPDRDAIRRKQIAACLRGMEIRPFMGRGEFATGPMPAPLLVSVDGAPVRLRAERGGTMMGQPVQLFLMGMADLLTAAKQDMAAVHRYCDQYAAAHPELKKTGEQLYNEAKRLSA